MTQGGYMDLAFEEAEAAGARGEVPVGAVVVRDGRVLARAGNTVEATGDPTAHAELLAIRLATEVLATDSERANAVGKALAGCDLYVTLEPCPMCAAAIGLARIRRLYYGASDPKGGGVESGPRIFDQPTCHHRPEIYPGIGDKRASALLKDFFRGRR